jgi:hypothetical protein
MSQWKLTPTRLNNAPPLLAGPILRRVEERSVTVWVAMQEAAKVTLEVYDNDVAGRNVLMSGQRPSIAVGRFLHIVAVTARAGTSLTAGNVYFYDVIFDFKNRGRMTLHQAANAANQALDTFAYAPFTLPSFALPPAAIQDVRVMHGSCRKPHGEGIDALPMLDDLIRDTAPSPTLRPHQLLLTGDQIYADDVAHALLLMLTDAGDVLLGWKEDLPTPTSRRAEMAATFHAEDFGPQSRGPLIEAAKFTTDDKRCHLMSLSEFLAMYLFAWSDVLWPAVLPESADFAAFNSWTTDQRKDFGNRLDHETGILYGFRPFLAIAKDRRSIRRALANVPTAMICDDHEVTDDWNMTRKFCEGVYGDPLGLRVVQNALTAYSLCQAWGDTPEQFGDDPQKPAGLQLLALLDPIGKAADATSPANFTAASPQIVKLVGLHDAGTLAAHSAPYRVFHEPGKYITVNGRDVNNTSIDYHYAIDSKAYKIIVTDSRTWRSFPAPGPDTHSVLIEPSMMPVQLGNVTPRLAGSRDLGSRLLMVVFTTNFPPITTIRIAAQHPGMVGLYEHDLFDSWEIPSRGFDQMIVEVTKLFPHAATIQGRVVVLSGDVHFTFASRLGYRAETRLGDPSGSAQPAKLVVAQLVGSALHNEDGNTKGEQLKGYSYTPSWYLGLVTPVNVPVGCAGWNYLGTAARVVGMGGDASVDVHPLTTAEPAYDFTELQDWVWSQKPDFRYRLDYVVTTESGLHSPTPPVVTPVKGSNAADRAQALKNFNTSGNFARDAYMWGRPDCVGYNNIGDISFYISGSDLGVRYKSHWQIFDISKDFWTPVASFFSTYEILLKVDDPHNYPDFPEQVATP